MKNGRATPLITSVCYVRLAVSEPKVSARFVSDIFGLQRAEAAHLAKHGAAFYRVDPHRRSLHGRRGWFQLRKLPADYADRNRRQREVNDPLDEFFLRYAFAFDIHESLLFRSSGPLVARRRPLLRPI